MIRETYSSFFRELQKNNTKEWFHTNKKHYEQEVRQPFVALLETIIPVLREWENAILPDPKKALFRINRDLRFSKDKTPYNLMMKAGLSPGGKKSVDPGYYLGIDAEHIHVGGGLFMIRPPELKRIRQHITANTDELIQITKAPKFIENFGVLKGEKAKRLDKDFQEVLQRTELIQHKQFYAFVEFPLAPFYNSSTLTEEILMHFEAIRPLNDYLSKALQ